MDERVWTDNCAGCGTTCAPTESAVHGDQRMDTYSCRCGRIWMTTRSVVTYVDFDFQPTQ